MMNDKVILIVGATSMIGKAWTSGHDHAKTYGYESLRNNLFMDISCTPQIF